MKLKWKFISSIIQIVIGSSALASFIILAVNGEDVKRWIPAAILAIAYVVLGTIDLVDYKRNKFASGDKTDEE